MINISTHDFYVILNYTSVLVMFICCVITALQAASKMQKLALMTCMALTMCCFGYLLRSVATNLAAYLAGQKVAYAFFTHAMFLILLFVLEYCRFNIPRWIMYVASGFNFLVTIGTLTMDYHDYFYKSCTAIPMDGYIIVEKDYGFIHSVGIGLVLVYMLASIVIAITSSIRNARSKSNNVVILVIATFLPIAAYFIPRFMGTTSDLLPPAWAAFSVIMLALIYMNKLYDINNIITEFFLDSMEEVYIVFDDRYRYKGCNREAERLFPGLSEIELDRDIREIEGPFADFLDGKAGEYRYDDVVWNVSVRRIEESGNVRGNVVRLEDVTIARRYTDLLQERQALIDKDLELARGIQLSALPNAGKVFSDEPRINVASFIKPANEVGGDFFDCYMLDKHRAVFLMADVSGKGIPAAMFMMRSKAIIKKHAIEGRDIHEIFTRANCELCDGNDDKMFVTVWMGIMDLDTGSISFANAGHNPPAVLRADGRCEFIPCHSDFVLAISDKMKYDSQEFKLEPGDRLFLYTDGVNEALDDRNELYGNDRIINFLQSSSSLTVEETLPAFKQNIDSFVGEAEQFDDITMMLIGYNGTLGNIHSI